MSKKITPIDSTRLYLRTSDRQFARLLWVRNDKLNDMFLGFYGVDGNPATITHEFPEHLIKEKGPFSIKYKDAIPVSIELDHFSFHPDGRFSLKRRGEGNDRHSHIERHADPISPDSGVFLKLMGGLRLRRLLQGDRGGAQAAARLGGC